MHLAHRRARWPILASLGVTALVAGCDSARNVTEPDPQDPRRSNIEYDYTDTYMSVNIDMRTETTVTADQTFTDPRTGQPTTSITVASPTEDISLSGGYNSYGDFVGELHHPLDSDVDPGTRVATTKFEWGQSANFDEYGNRMPDVLPDGTAAPAIAAEDYIPPEGEPLTSGVVVDEVAQFYDSGGGGGGSCGTQLVCQPTDHQMYSASLTMATKRRVEQPDENTVRVIDEMDEAMDPASGSAAMRVAGAQPAGKTRATRTYKKQNGKYILSEVRVERDEVGQNSRAHHVQTLRYKKVTWRRNLARDRQRAEKAKQAKAAAEPVSVMARATQAPVGRGGVPAHAVPMGARSSRAPAQVPAQAPQLQSLASGSARIVLQHGFAQKADYYHGSPAYWDITGKLVTETPLVTQSDYGAVFEAQAAVWTIPQIEGRWGANANAIIVGHSNGGIVGREVARQRPELVGGVVTVSSPHRGVNVLRYRDEGAAAMHSALIGTILRPVYATAWIGCNWFRIDLLCSFTEPDRVFSRVVGADGRPVPVWDQETPENGKDMYLQILNSRVENFPRTGIEQHTRQRWLLLRVLADGRTCGVAPGEEYAHPCGREAVATADRVYGHLRSLTAVRWTWNPLKFAKRVVVAAVAGAAMLAMNSIDALFNLVVGGRDRSDGLVQFSSQRYPNQSGEPVIVRPEDKADSHNASSYSPPAVKRLTATLAGFPFDVEARR